MSFPSKGTVWLAVGAVAIVCAFLGSAPARAQVASADPLLEGTPGWTFAVTPYAWLPTVSATLNYNTPRGGTATTDISSGVGDYLTKLNFALMVGGEARYDRFSLMTDLVYANASITSDSSHLSSFNPGPGPIFIPREQQLNTGTRMASTVWSAAGGYTLAQGGWGHIDAIAGLRMLVLGASTNYTLSDDVLLPDRTVGLSREGSLDLNRTFVDGIGGVAGRINIPNSKFSVPFYFDAGGGAVPFTWQIYGAIAYKASDRIDVSVGYRYLAFRNTGSTSEGVTKLDLGGPLLAANFHF